MIGSFSHIPYAKFALTLGPVALIGLIIRWPSSRSSIALSSQARPTGSAADKGRRQSRAGGAGAVAAFVMIGLFFAGVAPAKAAIIIGGLLLLTRRVKSRRVYDEIDWSLLLMFAGLFIIVGGAQHTLLTPDVIAAVGRLHLDQVPPLSVATAVLSNLVSNVPAVLMLKPFVEALKDHDSHGWWSLWLLPWPATSPCWARSPI